MYLRTADVSHFLSQICEEKMRGRLFKLPSQKCVLASFFLLKSLVIFRSKIFWKKKTCKYKHSACNSNLCLKIKINQSLQAKEAKGINFSIIIIQWVLVRNTFWKKQKLPNLFEIADILVFLKIQRSIM
jgi:hypothetical protein